MKRKDLENLTKDELIELVLSSRKEAEEAKSERERAIAETDAKLERAYAELSKANAEIDRLLALVDAKNQTILRDNFDRFVGKSEHSSAVRAKAPVIDEADAKAKGKPGRRKGSANLSLSREQLAAMASETITVEPDGRIGVDGLVRFGEDETYM